jgi:hypothetical protein
MCRGSYGIAVAILLTSLVPGKKRNKQVVEDGQFCITAGEASKASGTSGYANIKAGVLKENACFVFRLAVGSLRSPAVMRLCTLALFEVPYAQTVYPIKSA